jgi:type I restriction enzyme S subunit
MKILNWKTFKIEQLGQTVSGGTPKTNVKNYWDGDINWITPTDVTAMKGRKFIDSTNRKITKEGLESSSANMLPIGTLIICTRATIGDCVVNKIPISTNQGFKSLIPNDNVLSEYLYYWIISNKQTLINQSSGSTFLELSTKSFKNLDVIIPPLPEQQKISEILSTVDAKIEIIDQQISETYELKKGLMQQLLSKGIGHTEFKDSVLGKIPKSWEVVKQAEVATFYNGRAYKRTEWEESGIPVIRLQNLTGTGKDYYYSNLELPEHQYCHKGDLLYMWSATFGPVWWFGEKAIYHYHIWKIEHDSNRLNRDFHFYLLDSVTTRMKNQSHGSTMLHVTKGGMEKLSIQLPSISEQNQIAEILSSVDDKLQVLSEKKTTYQEMKQGLMQQLLTGKVRV